MVLKPFLRAWLFLLPALFVLFFTAGWPLMHSIWLSLTDAEFSNAWDANFIGFGNYLSFYDGEWTGLLVDKVWWRSVWNTVIFTVVSVLFETILGLIIALVLHTHFHGRGFLRAAVMVPWAIPTIVSAQMWAWMYNDQYGVINDLLIMLGIIAEPVAWTATPDFPMAAVIFTDVWKTTPFITLLILSALQMLPTECYEVAKIDGIHPVRVFFRVTLPLIKPAVIVAVIFRTLDAMRVFDLIYVLTSNSEDTMSMSMFARRYLVDFQETGYGSAASTMLFAVIAFFTVLFLMSTQAKYEPKKSI